MSLRLRLMGRRLLLVVFLAPFIPLLNSVAFCKEMNTLLEEIRKIEFTEIHCDEQRADYFRYVEGHIPILVSAPHGAKHYRRGDGSGHWKKEDAYTSSLAIALGQLTGAHVLYAKYKAGEDPNSDATCGYKDFLRKAVHEHNIRFIIDLHGASASQPFKIDVGTITDFPEKCSCPTFRPIIEKALQGFEEHAFNKHFAANGCGTITSFARNDLSIEAAQFEINARYRIVESRSNPDLKAREQDVLDMVARLQRTIVDINDAIQTNPTDQ